MTQSELPKFAEAMREATDRALAVADMLVRDLRLGSNHPFATVLELQREIILSLGKLSEIVAEVGEQQTSFLDSPEMKAAIHEGVMMGAQAGLQQVASEMRRRTVLHLCLVAATVVLGAVALNVGFTMGSSHRLASMAGDCLRQRAELTPASEWACAVLMPLK